MALDIRFAIGLNPGVLSKNGNICKVVPVINRGLSKSRYITLTQMLTFPLARLIQIRTFTVRKFSSHPTKNTIHPK